MNFRLFLRKNYPILLGAFALQIIFFGLALYYKALYLTDSAEYFYQAENIKNHGSLYSGKWQKPFILQMWTFRTPVYGYLVYLIQQISASHFVILILQNILAFLNFCGLVWLLKEVKLPRELLQGILFLTLLFFPTRLVYINMIMSEIILETFLFWGFFCLFQFILKSAPHLLLVYNLLLCLAVLTKPVLVYFWIPNLLFISYLGWKYQQQKVVFYGLFMPFTIAALCFYNQQVTGYFHYSSIKTYNLSDYNTKALLVNLYGLEYANKKIGEITKTDSDFTGLEDRLEHIEAESYKIIKANLGYYCWLHFRGMINFFLDPSRYDLYNFLPPLQTKTEFSFFNEWRLHGFAGIANYITKLPIGLTIYMGLIFIVNLITTAGLIFYVFCRKYSLILRFFIALLIVYISAASGPIGCSRFKEPVYLLIVFATVFAAEAWYNRRKASA